MNKDKMLEWADVLESGKYKQHQGGWGSLKRGSLCCLNVALVHFTGTESYEHDFPVTASAEIFNENVDWCTQFFIMNDNHKLTFPEIAIKIREMVE